VLIATDIAARDLDVDRSDMSSATTRTVDRCVHQWDDRAGGRSRRSCQLYYARQAADGPEILKLTDKQDALTQDNGPVSRARYCKARGGEECPVRPFV
jgi:hypothetical protein